MNLYFRRIRREDELISFDSLEKYSEQELDFYCFQRGIEIQGRAREQKIKDIRLWMAISNLRNVPHSLLLFSRITEQTEDLFKIDEDEDEYEILRRVSKTFIN